MGRGGRGVSKIGDVRDRKQKELRRSSQELEEAGKEIRSYQTQADRYAADVERVKLQCELEKHRAIESLREEHVDKQRYKQIAKPSLKQCTICLGRISLLSNWKRTR